MSRLHTWLSLSTHPRGSARQCLSSHSPGHGSTAAPSPEDLGEMFPPIILAPTEDLYEQSLELAKRCSLAPSPHLSAGFYPEGRVTNSSSGCGTWRQWGTTFSSTFLYSPSFFQDSQITFVTGPTLKTHYHLQNSNFQLQLSIRPSVPVFKVLKIQQTMNPSAPTHLWPAQPWPQTSHPQSSWDEL